MYDGQWLDNKISGFGIYLWSDGRKFYGQWSENDMHGCGIYIYADNVRYDGQFINDKKQGFGAYQWTDGRKYEGWWFKGKQHGLGTYYDNNKGSKKHGIWENGKRVKWFSEETVSLINQGAYDASINFADPDSVHGFQKKSSLQSP